MKIIFKTKLPDLNAHDYSKRRIGLTDELVQSLINKLIVIKIHGNSIGPLKNNLSPINPVFLNIKSVVFDPEIKMKILLLFSSNLKIF